MPIAFSERVSEILEREHVFKPAKELAIWYCQGHFGKVYMFFEALERRGGLVVPGTTLTYGRVHKGSLEFSFAFLGTEDEVFEKLDAIKDTKKSVPTSVAAKMLSLRIVKVMKGIAEHNKNESQRAENMRIQLAQPNPPAWMKPYTPEYLPDLTLEDIPDFARYLNQPSISNSAVRRGYWSWLGDGKAILELQKLMKRPDMTPEALEQAWKLATVHQVMSG